MDVIQIIAVSCIVILTGFVGWITFGNIIDVFQLKNSFRDLLRINANMAEDIEDLEEAVEDLQTGTKLLADSIRIGMDTTEDLSGYFETEMEAITAEVKAISKKQPTNVNINVGNLPIGVEDDICLQLPEDASKNLPHHLTNHPGTWGPIETYTI